MTENESIEKILYMGVGRSGSENESSIIAKALSELMEYRAIGTVAEFKNAKRSVHIADMAVEHIEKGKQEIRAKVIDEFVERINVHVFEEKTEEQYSNSVSFMREIKQIAEQMKAGDK